MFNSKSAYIARLERGNVCEKAAAIALANGDAEGAQLKWVMDQMLKLILGWQYPNAIIVYQRDGKEWDHGEKPSS